MIQSQNKTLFRKKAGILFIKTYIYFNINYSYAGSSKILILIFQFIIILLKLVYLLYLYDFLESNSENNFEVLV